MLYVWLWIRLYCYYFFCIVHESTWCLFAVCCLKARMLFLRDYSRHYLVSLGLSVDETCKKKTVARPTQELEYMFVINFVIFNFRAPP